MEKQNAKYGMCYSYIENPKTLPEILHNKVKDLLREKGLRCKVLFHELRSARSTITNFFSVCGVNRTWGAYAELQLWAADKENISVVDRDYKELVTDILLSSHGHACFMALRLPKHHFDLYMQPHIALPEEFKDIVLHVALYKGLAIPKSLQARARGVKQRRTNTTINWSKLIPIETTEEATANTAEVEEIPAYVEQSEIEDAPEPETVPEFIPEPAPATVEEDDGEIESATAQEPEQTPDPILPEPVPSPIVSSIETTSYVGDRKVIDYEKIFEKKLDEMIEWEKKQVGTTGEAALVDSPEPDSEGSDAVFVEDDSTEEQEQEPSTEMAPVMDATDLTNRILPEEINNDQPIQAISVDEVFSGDSITDIRLRYSELQMKRIEASALYYGLSVPGFIDKLIMEHCYSVRERE